MLVKPGVDDRCFKVARVLSAGQVGAGLTDRI